MAAEIGTAELAKRHGVDRATAYRWMKELEAKYGPSVIARRGRRGKLVTTAEAFAKVAPLAAGVGRDEQRFAEVLSRLEDLERRCSVQADRIQVLEDLLRAERK